MPKHPLTVEDLWAMPRVGAPRPSPDGKRFVVPVTRWSMETNESVTQLWLAPSDARRAGAGGRGDPARALTGTEAAADQPSWSPCGRRLAFVHKPGGEKVEAGSGKEGPSHPDQPQLYLMDLEGGEPERLTDLPLGLADPQWFPDGRRIAFLVPLYGEALTPEGTAKLAEERDDDPLEVHVTEDRVYRFWDRELTPGKFPHIFVLDLETREMMDLTPDSLRWFDWMEPTGQFRIAPGGEEIAFAACKTKPPHDPILWGTFTVKVPKRTRAGARAGRAREISRGHKADAWRPVYSPDGRWILYGMQRDIDFYADRVRLVAYDRKTGAHTVLTEAWDRSAHAWEFARDSRTVIILTEDEARTAYFRLDLPAAMKDAGAKAPRRLVRGGTYGAPHIAGGRIFTNLHSLSKPSEVVTLDLEGKGRRRVTAFTDKMMREIDLGAVREEHFKGAGGRRVQMFLVYPPGVKPPAPGKAASKQLPLVQVIHGGPHGISGDNWHWRWNPQAFAAPGYLVATVNFHGSTSWGQEFAKCIQGRWGDQPYEDIMAATDHLIERGLADPKRMAAAGGSYGGYMTTWIASQTDRFACLVNHAGVCDFQSQIGSDITQGDEQNLGGVPWKDIEALDRYNPIRHARGFRSPMLVLHGQKDYRVPYYQGLEVYNIYKAMGLPARLAVYPEENHWILHPRTGRHWYGEVLGWLERWIGKKTR